MIEAYEYGDRVLATQWHPERLLDEGMLPIWQWFIRRCNAKRGGFAVKFAVIGSGTIVEKFISAGRLVKDFELVAVYSRTEAREGIRRRAGRKYAFSPRWTNWPPVRKLRRSILPAPTMRTANSPFGCSRQASTFLCEKPMASNAREVRRMQGCAKAHGVVLLEAMKSVFEPSFDVLRKALPRLGTLRRATLSYCQYSSRYDKFKAGEILNAFNPALSNGALMDIGVYCVHRRRCSSACRRPSMPPASSSPTVWTARAARC